jgi:hypothetical protein
VCPRQLSFDSALLLLRYSFRESGSGKFGFGPMTRHSYNDPTPSAARVLRADGCILINAVHGNQMSEKSANRGIAVPCRSKTSEVSERCSPTCHDGASREAEPELFWSLSPNAFAWSSDFRAGAQRTIHFVRECDKRLPRKEPGGYPTGTSS